MPIDGSFINFAQAGFLTKIFLVLFLIFYTVFSLILFRQIQLMNKNMPTTLAPFLKFIAIVNLGLAVAVLFLVIGNY